MTQELRVYEGKFTVDQEDRRKVRVAGNNIAQIAAVIGIPQFEVETCYRVIEDVSDASLMLKNPNIAYIKSYEEGDRVFWSRLSDEIIINQVPIRTPRELYDAIGVEGDLSPMDSANLNMECFATFNSRYIVEEDQNGNRRLKGLRENGCDPFIFFPPYIPNIINDENELMRIFDSHFNEFNRFIRKPSPKDELDGAPTNVRLWKTGDGFINMSDMSTGEHNHYPRALIMAMLDQVERDKDVA